MTPPPISIKLGSNSSRPYLSLDEIEWTNIPPFAVLTGLNGSGKTQFLQALAYKLAKMDGLGQFGTLARMPFGISGDTFDVQDIAYLATSEHSFRVEDLNVSNMVQAKTQFLNRMQQNQTQNSIEAEILRCRIKHLYGVEGTNAPTPQDLAKLPDDFMYMMEYNDVSAGMGYVFVGYQFRRAQLLMGGLDEQRILEKLGKPPWVIVNDALAASEFGYRIVVPTNDLLQSYRVMVEPVEGGPPLNLFNLSSGEKIILRTILWFYNTRHNNVYPKLFLMDEPDAHLHPSMTRQFIDVLYNVLVEQYGVRVILTTHSPSTVALAPEGSVFVMSRTQPRIRGATSAEAIGLLTSGLVIVSAGTRFVLVEDDDDVNFYTTIKDILSEQGPSKDKMALNAAPSIVFMPASRGRGATRTGGGSSVVTQWVEKFDAPPLAEIFRGIIDCDSGARPSDPRVSVLGRYSIENYQLDPINVFGLLIEERNAPSLPSISISAGDEHLLRTLAHPQLQTIVNYVSQRVQPSLGTLLAADTATRTVEFTNGIKLDYPAWMLKKRGHDLLPIYQRVFGPRIVTAPRLDIMLRRIRMVPVELASILAQMQS